MEYQQKRQKLKDALHDLDIDLPMKATGRMGTYLLRGDPKLDRWTKNTIFHPQSGEWAKWGVFLGDNLSCLMYPLPGIFWVFESKRLTTDWLLSNSKEFSELTLKNAESLGVNHKTVNGGFECERKIYEQYSVYHPETGIATVNYPVPSELAYAAIFMMAGGVEVK